MKTVRPYITRKGRSDERSLHDLTWVDAIGAFAISMYQKGYQEIDSKTPSAYGFNPESLHLANKFSSLL